ncbi:FISUMP domain-containing protein [Sphingobacterium paucimobilis]|nr:FISUMP domain-containing protein [Sphingobacterium paucimobilis]
MKNNIFYFVILFLCGCTLLSCKKETINIEEVQLDNIELNFNKSGQSTLLEIPVNEKSNGWHVYSPSQDTWLTHEIVPGRSSMYVYVDGNNTDQSRSSYIVISSGNYTQKIIVTQDKEGGVDLSQTYVPVRYLNSSAQVTITNFEDLTDIAVTQEEGTASWLSILTEGDKINLNVKINELTTAKQALITVTAKRRVSGESVTSFINLYQGKGGMTPYIIEIPDFTASSVYKVMDGNKQVAQITKEFLRGVDKVNAQAVVVYPVENDVVYINKGYVAQVVLENKDLKDLTYNYAAPTGAVHGGTVSFNIGGNTISGYVAGSEATPVTTIYMPGDVGMGTDVIPDSKQTTVVPHVIEDVRNSETQIYPIVKIGTQYWMGKNLNTMYYNQNKNFQGIPTNLNSSFMNPNYHINGYNNGASTAAGAITNRERFGFLYAYLAIGGFNTVAEAGLVNEDDVIADNISPEGWLVPTVQEATKLRDYLSRLSRLRNFVMYDENTSIGFTPDQDDNITGFNAPNGSYKSGNTAWAAFGNANGAWYLTRSFKDVNNNKLFHMNGIQSSQAMYRNSSIRSLNAGAIKITDSDS